jgi:hypothetical protein
MAGAARVSSRRSDAHRIVRPRDVAVNRDAIRALLRRWKRKERFVALKSSSYFPKTLGIRLVSQLAPTLEIRTTTSAEGSNELTAWRVNDRAD